MKLLLQIREVLREARLRRANLPMPDTLQFANNVSISGEIDIDLTWRTIRDPVSRGNDNTVPPEDPPAFPESSPGFPAEFGHDRNAVFA